MKTILKVTFYLFSVCQPLSLYSQITISEINKTEEIAILKPQPYDSLKNWEVHERIGDYKQYIGLQVYLPPFENPSIGVKNSTIISPFMFSNKLTKVELIGSELKLFQRVFNINSHKFDTVGIYTNALTEVYSPYPYMKRDEPSGYSMNERFAYNDLNIYISNDKSVSNKYYTIIDIIYSEKLRAHLNHSKNEIEKLRSITNKDLYKTYVHENRIINNNPDINKLYILRSDLNGDTIYCSNINRFILVPFFLKQKELYQNKNLIYDDEKDNYGSFINRELIGYDLRRTIKSENYNGVEESNSKKVVVPIGSKWLCSEVTLIKSELKKDNYNSEQTYEINYILTNDKDEQINLTKLNGFITEQEHTIRETNKKIQKELLIAKIKQEEQIQNEINQKNIEKRKEYCVAQFGQQLGELVAQKKVRIGMTKEMCETAWGKPLWTKKTTTAQGTDENWYYWLGYSLHFKNESLIKIVE